MSKERKGYIISRVTLENDIGVGCFTNKSKLFDKIEKLHPNSDIKVFSGVLEYEDKKINYFNLTKLLNIIDDNEFFYINYVVENKIVSYEIKKIIMNN